MRLSATAELMVDCAYAPSTPLRRQTQPKTRPSRKNGVGIQSSEPGMALSSFRNPLTPIGEGDDHQAEGGGVDCVHRVERVLWRSERAPCSSWRVEVRGGGADEKSRSVRGVRDQVRAVARLFVMATSEERERWARSTAVETARYPMKGECEREELCRKVRGCESQRLDATEGRADCTVETQQVYFAAQAQSGRRCSRVCSLFEPALSLHPASRDPLLCNPR